MQFSPLRLIFEEGIEKLHEATMKILDGTGLDVHSKKARERFARAGAKVDGQRVCIPHRVVEEALVSLPSTVRLAGRQGRPDCLLDGRKTYFSSFLAINIVDLEIGNRRPCRLEDIRDHCRLVDAL